MEDLRFGAAIRAARARRGWRQIDVSKAAGVSESTVSRLERGMVGGLQLRTIRAVAAVLEVQVELLPRSRAAGLERIVNQAHATLAEHVVAWIAGKVGWAVRPEVSFSRYGERGVIDVLAWHAASQSLLVIELKTEIVDVGEVLGTLDRKLRNSRFVALDLGWAVASVSGVLIVGDSDVNRRRVGAHAATFAAAYPGRIVEVRRWLAEPRGALRGLMFFANRHSRKPGERLTTIRRVRSPRRSDGTRVSAPGTLESRRRGRQGASSPR
jgi:transcriptional regulator with XRE-family HTH domain